MKKLTSKKVQKLSLSDLAVVQNALLAHIRKTNGRNVISVGFGQKKTDGKVVPDSFCAKFVVRAKYDPEYDKVKIPSPTIQIEVPGLLGDESAIVELETDVVECKSLPQFTAANIPFKVVSTGALVAWQSPAGWDWGIMSVSHAFDEDDLNDNFDVIPPEGETFQAKLRYLSVGVIDAALLSISLREAEILFGKSIPDPPPSVGFFDSNTIESGFEGENLSLQRNVPFTTGTVYPTFEIEGRMLAGIVELEGNLEDGFAYGTSGSFSRIKYDDSEAIGTVQVGALPPSFEIGYGQLAGELFDWLTVNFRLPGLRFVHTF